MKNLREVKVGPMQGGALKKLPHPPKGPLNPKSRAKATADEKPDPDATVVSYVNECHTKGDEYRRKFKTRWDEIEAQIRCVHPEAWTEKEDWQTKVFVPQQSKTSETAQAYLDKMLFGSKRFFGIQGVEQRDKEEEAAIEELYDNFFERGSFPIENDFVLNEACSGPGTSFIKVTLKPDRTGLVFTWRSAYNVTLDPSACHKLEYSQYIIDEYERPLQTLVDDVTKGTSIYAKEKIDALVKAAEAAGQSLSDKALATVKGFDGTAVSIDPAYKMVKLKEFWGMARTTEKSKDGKDTEKWDDRIVVVANSTKCIRNDHNDYGFKPFFACRVKPRKYDFYALGFLDNVVDLQELTNSMINLGFDSLKMCSMDIGIVDETKVKDPASIEYRPMAIWKMKGNPRESVLLTRQGVSALAEIMRALALLDQFNQEATGVLRQVQGAPTLGGGTSETLGEYQAKLAMIDNRFLKIARFIERDYIEPMLRGMFKIVFNKEFFNQKLVDRIIGTKTVKVQDPLNPMAVLEKEVPKLDYDKIASQGEMGYDFSAYGMTQFSKSLETLQKLRELLEIVVKTPQLQLLFNIKELVKRTLRAAEIQDFEDLMKSDEEIKNIMQQVYSGTGGGQPQPGQPPQGPPMPESAAY